MASALKVNANAKLVTQVSIVLNKFVLIIVQITVSAQMRLFSNVFVIKVMKATTAQIKLV